MKKIFPCVCLLVSLFTNTVIARNYYVSSILGSNGFSGTLAQPYATPQRAADLTQPGDTVFIMTGSYSSTNNFTILRITRSGTATNPIVYMRYANNNPVFELNVWHGILISDGARYIVVDGIKIRGNNRNVTLTQALNQPGSCANPNGSVSPIYNGNGVSIEPRSAGNYCHHITVKNMEIYECGGGGINAIEADYITFEDNIVYNNCWYTVFANSGINIFHSWNFDNEAVAFKMIIRRNITYGNRLFVPWKDINPCAITDGNGIIYDDNRNTQSSSPFQGTPYFGKALIENNISYRNGGRGIHSYISDNVTIRNNTTFQNSLSNEIDEGEITAITGSNISIYNNIMYARAGKRANTSSNVTNFVSNNNLMFNSGLRSFFATNDLLIDPQFVDTATNNFKLKNISPAINAGSNTAGTFSAKDILGIDRPAGSLPDIGAYEFTGMVATSNFTQGNIVATKVGDGTATLNNNTAAVELVEYSPNGIPSGINVVLSNASSPRLRRLLVSGNATTGEGQLNLSSDGRTLTVAGYDTSLNAITSAYFASTKVIATVGFNAVPDFSTRISNATYNRTVRAAITDNVNRIFVTGFSVSPASSSSTRFLPFGTPSTTNSTPFSGSVRSIKMFKNQVYFSENNEVGTLTPDPNASNFAIVSKFSGVNIAGHNYQTMFLLDMDAVVSFNGTGYDLLYCADQNLGLVKFYWNGSTWVFAGSFNPTSATGVSGGLFDLTVRLNNARIPEIFAVKGAVSNNNIVSLTDVSGFTGNISSISPTAQNLVSAGANYMFRGVAFSPIQLVTLPVDLLSFKTYVVNNNVQINWATASEINVSSFVIEKSSDATRFSTLTTLIPNNNIIGATYNFTDQNPNQPITYYRLKIIDKDGSFKYSSVVAVRSLTGKTNKLDVYPNPTKNFFSVSYPKAIENTSIEIFTSDGKKLGEYNVLIGSNQRSIDIASFPIGVYVMVYKNAQQNISTKFIKE